MLDSATVGKVIQRFREEKKLSQEVLSGFADIGSGDALHLPCKLFLRKSSLGTRFFYEGADFFCHVQISFVIC